MNKKKTGILIIFLLLYIINFVLIKKLHFKNEITPINKSAAFLFRYNNI